MKIGPAQRTHDGDETEIAVEVTSEAKPTGDRLWYRVERRHAPMLTDTMDPFLLAALFVAMRTGESLHAAGGVTATLLENLEEFQSAWLQWRPERYTRVEITADEELPDRPGPDDRSALQTFSGGADSAYTTIRHVSGAAGRGSLRLTGAVMVHGFDIPLEERGSYETLRDRSAPLLAGQGIELLPVTTNFRQLWHSDLSHWEDAFGTGMTSVLTLFSGRFRHGLIASSEPYGSLLLPWGSNPVTDWMMSGGRLRVHHDATGVDRNDKVAGLARLWPEGAGNLRVCWQGEQKDRNCCRCEKCIRTILNFKVSGAAVPASFPLEVGPGHIRSLRGLSEAHINPLRQILAAAHARGTEEDWVAALADCVAANEDELARGVSYEGGFPLLATDTPR
ncbi:hypothetical protein [Streptomyces xinghaiensis]|uniref:hypothetical protein n=1 Tax=Streptomyces xinghaiensis TaxID=1038928 RepID=UPI0002DB6BA1|nr:hypothetical protein [Streptomyces xinghaiensis]MZE78363.1 hypothetical protein [Streptomyces sp. SID5475]